MISELDGGRRHRVFRIGALPELAADSLGADVQHPWDAMVAAMAIGVAVGMRSRLGAIFLIPELLGDSEAGDLIVEANGNPVRSILDLAGNEPIESIGVLRGAQSIEIPLDPHDRPPRR